MAETICAVLIIQIEIVKSLENVKSSENEFPVANKDSFLLLQVNRRLLCMYEF